MKRTHHAIRSLVCAVLTLTFVLGLFLMVPTAVLAQEPTTPPPPGVPPVQPPGNGPDRPGVPNVPPSTGGSNPVPADEDCPIGNPNCDPMGSYAIIPNLVQIWHDQPDGAPYHAYSRIRISMTHTYGGYVYLYDWQPYMGQWPRFLGMYWLPAGYPRVITAQVVPPYGPEWLTIYDPYTGAWDRTYFQVVP